MFLWHKTVYDGLLLDCCFVGKQSLGSLRMKDLLDENMCNCKKSTEENNNGMLLEITLVECRNSVAALSDDIFCSLI